MYAIITYKLFSCRSNYSHCFLVINTSVVDNKGNVLAFTDATMTGNTDYERRVILRKFRKFLHADDNGATRQVWTFQNYDGATCSIEKMWNS